MFAASKSGRRVVTATDPYFPYVSLLAETTSTNGQTNNTFLDSSVNNFTITRTGTPSQGSVTPYWTDGYWGNYFPSATSQYLSASYNAAFNIPSSTPFTIEFWFNTTGLSGNHTFFSNYGGGVGIVVQFRVGANIFRLGLGDSVILDSSAQTITAGVWYHFAVVRNSSNSISMYLNGSSIATPVTNSGALGATSQGPWIGGLPGVGQYYPGYLSNLRFVNGTAVYTSAFTPPTSALTAITNTALLTCQSNRFKDNSTNNFVLTPTNIPQALPVQPFNPPSSYTSAAYAGSGLFRGELTSYLTAPASTSWQFTADYTIEVWVYLLGLTADQTIYATGGSGSADQFNITSTGQLFWANQTTSAGVVTTNQWIHLAAARSGSTLKLFVNGVVQLTATVSGTTGQNLTAYISRRSDAVNAFNGYMSGLRIVNGTAVYTANFTPPTSPVTAITNTSLLLSFSNAGVYDAAVQNVFLTFSSAQSSTSQYKWSPTSIKFNGTTDYLSALDSQSGILATYLVGVSTWTIECWFYNTGSTISSVFSKGGNYSTIPGSYELRVVGSDGSGTFYLGNNTITPVYSFSYIAGTFPLSSAPAWVYFAAVRSSTGVITTYVNGVLKSTSSSGITLASSSNEYFIIGATNPAGSAPFSGYIQDFRITKGIARTITTPTAAFPTK